MEDTEKAATNEGHARPERVTAFKDYLRIFTYATRFDYVLIVPAVVASVGAGVVGGCPASEARCIPNLCLCYRLSP